MSILDIELHNLTYANLTVPETAVDLVTQNLITRELKNQEMALANGDIDRAIQAEKNLIALGAQPMDPNSAHGNTQLSAQSQHYARLELESATYKLKTRLVVAHGRKVQDGFEVFKGSGASLDETNSGAKAKAAHTKRESLIEKGLLVRDGDILVFTENVVFNSPSLAATVIRGTPANGLAGWKKAN